MEAQESCNGKSANHMAVIQLKILGYPIANIRKSLHKLTGITQPTVAEKINRSRQTVTIAMETGGRNEQIRQAIAEVFDVPVYELFSDVHSKNPPSWDGSYSG